MPPTVGIEIWHGTAIFDGPIKTSTAIRWASNARQRHVIRHYLRIRQGCGANDDPELRRDTSVKQQQRYQPRPTLVSFCKKFEINMNWEQCETLLTRNLPLPGIWVYPWPLAWFGTTSNTRTALLPRRNKRLSVATWRGWSRNAQWGRWKRGSQWQCCKPLPKVWSHGCS